jgi:hypothetical protein
VLDAPVEEELFPVAVVVVAAPGEPEFDWSNLWPTLLQEASKQARPAIAIIRFMFQLTYLRGTEKACRFYAKTAGESRRKNSRRFAVSAGE